MVHFGRQLQAAQRPEWRAQYLDYNALKQQLERAFEDQSMGVEFEEMVFAEALDQEVEKVVLFYLTEIGRLADRLQLQRQRRKECVSDDELLDLLANYQAVGQDVIGVSRPD
jgi:SPX domain protein involved in polyphosphate accumulation